MNQEKIWDYFQTDGIQAFSGNEQRLTFIANKIKPTENTILNIGIGNGFLEALLQKKGKKVFALDPSSIAVENLKKRLGHLNIVAKVGYSQEIPFSSDKFDIVIMSEVLEHLESRILMQTIQEVYRVLRPGGRFIGTVPAEEDLKLNECICPKCGYLFHRWGHSQEFSKEKLKNLLSTQFSHCIIKRQFFSDWPINNWQGKVKYFLKNIAILLGMYEKKGGSFVFIAQKA